jgi:BlaI family transcriptional regulator, penicillinase repressor
MSKKNVPALSPANFEVMKVIWEKGETTVNEVFEIINTSRKDKLRRTTIQVQMNRLEEYGWLTHRKEGRTFYYSAVIAQQETRRDMVEDLKERVFSGSPTELVKCLFDGSAIKKEEIKELRDLLDQFDRGELK